MKPWRLLEVNYNFVKENMYEVAVLPTGATEPHNLHLPYGSDAITTERVGDLICERAYDLGAKVALLPVIPFGVDSNLMKFPMTISLKPSTIDIVLRDIIQSIESHGIRKLVILNGHGGNSLKHTLREFYGTTEVFLNLVNWYEVAKDLYPSLIEHRDGDHADEMETSVVMYLFPDQVHLELADEGRVKPSQFEAINKGWVQITRPWHLVTTNSGVGNPYKATPEKGKQIIETVVDRIAPYLKELSDAKMHERFPY